MTEDDYDKQQKALMADIKKASKDTDSKILDNVAKSKEESEKFKKASEILHMLFREMMEMIEHGDMNIEEALDDFVTAAKAVKL